MPIIEKIGNTKIKKIKFNIGTSLLTFWYISIHFFYLYNNHLKWILWGSNEIKHRNCLPQRLGHAWWYKCELFRIQSTIIGGNWSKRVTVAFDIHFIKWKKWPLKKPSLHHHCISAMGIITFNDLPRWWPSADMVSQVRFSDLWWQEEDLRPGILPFL